METRINMEIEHMIIHKKWMESRDDVIKHPSGHGWVYKKEVDK